MENGVFQAKGHKFDVEPVFLKEIKEYNKDCPFVPPLKNAEGEPLEEKEISRFLIGCFTKETKDVSMEKENPLKEKGKGFFAKCVEKMFPKKILQDPPKTIGDGFVKWIEKKVTLNGNPISFYDLESVHKLNKVEIAKLIAYLSEFSGF